MARKVFFSFDFGQDAWRVGQVRNSNAIRSSYDQTTFLDRAEWEKIERTGDAAIKHWIDEQMKGTSVSVVLIGSRTARRPWVRYEIEESWKKGNGLLGIYIHNVKNPYGSTDAQGANPFDGLIREIGPIRVDLGHYLKTYDWVNNDGRSNIGAWIEAAYSQRNGNWNR